MLTTQVTRANRGFLPWLPLLLLGSGCAALIYEVVWFQLLQLVIGLTNLSLGLLLGTFMGGLCLGSLLLPRLVSRKHHPLRVYACLELAIGAAAIGILFIVPWAARLYSIQGPHGLTGVFLRGLFAALCLLPPTLLMGATLPAVARWMESTRESISWLGLVYAGNIVGAVLGCLIAGFYLLPAYNMAIATAAAAALNCALAIAGFCLAGRAPKGSEALGKNPESAESAGETSVRGARPGRTPTRSIAAVIYVAVGLSGLTALGAEVVWTRLLSLLLGGTVYTFSIILAVFLTGLGIGSLIGTLVSRTGLHPRAAFGLCQLFLVLAISWTAWMIANSLPYWPINPALSRSPWFNFQLDLARCLWAVLPAAIFWGASFPLALSAMGSASDPAGVVARVYAANTVGAIIGALGFSLLVIPLTGTRAAERLLVVISGAGAALLFGSLLLERGLGLAGRRWSMAGIAASLLCGGFLAWQISETPWGLIAYGRFMATYGDRLAPGVRPEQAVPSGNVRPDIYATYVGEGLNGSVAVTKWSSGTRNFHSAGKVQASTEPSDMRLQRMLGHLSALAQGEPASVLVVACGAGVTAGSFVVHPSVKRIVICDIEPLVPRKVAPMFAKENHAVLADPRTEVIVDDGRHYIRTTREMFDVITSDPIDPWVKGCAALNTVEYYEMCKSHLKPGGVMSLWIPFYETNVETLKSVLASFFKVFPNGILWSNDNEEGGYDGILFGQAGQTEIDVDQLQDRLNQPGYARVKESLREVGFHSAVSLLATYAGQAQDLKEWMRGAQINTDRNLRLQYLAGKSFNSFMSADILNGIIRYQKFPEKIFIGSGPRRALLKARFRGWGAEGKDAPKDAGRNSETPPN